MKFTETKLEHAIIDLLEQEKYHHVIGTEINRDLTEVLIKGDLQAFLSMRYAEDHITNSEIESIIRKLQVFSASDLYESNKAIMKLISDGFLHKREDRSKKDLFINLIDYSDDKSNIYKIVNQLEISGYEKRIPDGELHPIN